MPLLLAEPDKEALDRYFASFDSTRGLATIK